MTNRSRALIGIITVLFAAAVLSAASSGEPATAAVQPEGAAKAVMPRYDAQGQLILPQDWRRWVFAGSSLGLSYAQGGPATAGMEMFHETLMEPTAYQHFVNTGTFREGTMLVLVLHGTGEGVLPARRGRFAAELHGVEMAVKDSTRRPEGWAYYNFGGMSGIRNTAQAMPKESCYSCHVEHATRETRERLRSRGQAMSDALAAAHSSSARRRPQSTSAAGASSSALAPVIRASDLSIRSRTISAVLFGGDRPVEPPLSQRRGCDPLGVVARGAGRSSSQRGDHAAFPVTAPVSRTTISPLHRVTISR